MTITRFVAGLTGFAVGVGLLASLPIIPTWQTLTAGWVLLLTGIAIAAPALLDLIDPDGQP